MPTNKYECNAYEFVTSQLSTKFCSIHFIILTVLQQIGRSKFVFTKT